MGGRNDRFMMRLTLTGGIPNIPWYSLAVELRAGYKPAPTPVIMPARVDNIRVAGLIIPVRGKNISIRGTGQS